MILVGEKYVDIFGSGFNIGKKKKEEEKKILKRPLTFGYKNLQILVLVRLLTMPANNLQIPVFSVRISLVRYKRIPMKITL
jgi:hypothetical protein